MQPQYKDIEANIFVDGVRIGAAVTKTASGNDILWRDSINVGSGARGKLKFSQAVSSPGRLSLINAER